MNANISKARILVTGGAGFIGSNLCEFLVRNGAEVVCVDNLITGHEENILALFNNPLFEFHHLDIRDLDSLAEVMKGCTHVCHQAALGSVPRSIENPVHTNEHNITGSLNVFWAAHQAGIRRVVYASSSSVYGDEATLPKIEDRTGQLLSPYAVTKDVSESYATVFSNLYDMQMIGLRYFNVFGRRQDPDGAYAAVIPRFAKLLIEKKSPIIHGDGKQSRDFTHIDNVIQANTKALFLDSTNQMDEKINIAFGSRITINQLFNLLKLNLAEFDNEISGIEPVHSEDRPGDIKHSLADISNARKVIGYNPKVDLESGLESYMKWFWEQHSS